MGLFKKWEKGFATGKERKELVKKSRERVGYLGDRMMAEDDTWSQWNYRDSPLDDRGNSNEYPFLQSFAGVLPEGEKSLRNFIESTLAHKRGNAIGIEYGGPGSAVFSQFTSGFFKRSAGLTLFDTRKALSDDPSVSDEERHHTVLQGDILDDGMAKTIDTWRADEKVDLVLERMAGGLKMMPQEPHLLAKRLQEAYQSLAEGGVMLIETPGFLNPLLKPWGKMIQEKYSEVLEIRFTLGQVSDDFITSGAVYLRKLPGAPHDLPMLHPRDVKEAGVEGGIEHLKDRDWWKRLKGE